MTRKILILLSALAALAIFAPAATAHPPHHRCRAGYVRRKRHGHYRCVRRKRHRASASRVVRYKTRVDPSFTQSPTNPLDVTYAYSADATATIDGVVTDLAATDQLPAGVLNLYSQATAGGPEQLFCSINVGGSASSGSCEVAYEQTGTYDVTTQYIPNAGSAVTETDVETISPYATTTDLSVAETGCDGSGCSYSMTTGVVDQMGNDVTPPELTLTATPSCPNCGASVQGHDQPQTFPIPSGTCMIDVSVAGYVDSPDCDFSTSGNDDATSWTLSVAFGGSPSRTDSVSAPVSVTW